MDEDTQHRRSYFFTVRIWPEDMGDGKIEWRGKAQYLPNGMICYFRDWPALLAFLEKRKPQEENSQEDEPDSQGVSP